MSLPSRSRGVDGVDYFSPEWEEKNRKRKEEGAAPKQTDAITSGRGRWRRGRKFTEDRK